MSDILLTFVHVSDTHISHDPHYNTGGAAHTPMIGARALVHTLKQLPFTPDFVLHTGDVVYDPDPEAYTTAREIFNEVEHPLYFIPGNHDDPAALQRLMLDREPVTPFDQTFTQNGVRVILMDSLRPTDDPYKVRGRVSPDQLAWLRDTCAADDLPIVVGVHHNVLPIGGGFWDKHMIMENGREFHETLVPFRDRVRGVFFGHVHQNTDTLRDGILYVSALSTWYQLHTYPRQDDITQDRYAGPGFNIVTVTREQTFIRRYRYTVDAGSLE